MPLKTLSTGVYRATYSIRAVVNTSVGRKEKRFPLDADLADIKRWRNEIAGKFAAVARRRKPVAHRGTLSADIRRYLKLVQGLASWKSRRSELAAWATLFGSKRRSQITEAMVRTAVTAWRTKGRNVGTEAVPAWKPYAVRTCEHRVAALRHLFHTLDGADLPTPCDALTFDIPPTTPVWVPAATIRSVVDALTDPKAQARLMVLATTGVRPAELMRTHPEDVDLQHGIWWIRTAKGGQRPPLHLNPEMRAAWAAYQRANAWGPYDTSTHAKALYAAGWPRAVRPYNARATFGIELSKRGADLADIQQLMGHRDQKTTRAYYVPPEQSRLAAASRSLGNRFGWKGTKREAG